MRLKTAKDVQNLYKLEEMKKNPNTPLGMAVGLRIKNRGGYIGKLNRLQKKTPGQMKGMPGCGPKTKDFLRGY